MNNYTLSKPTHQDTKSNILLTAKSLLPFLESEKRHLILAAIAVFISTGLNLLAPILIGHTVDTFIQAGNFQGVLSFALILFCMFVAAMVAGYFQTMLMGTVGQNVLFNLRNALFNKIQALPVAFFNQNKAGDLISRINNDTDKLNQFFSQGLVMFLSNAITIFGAGIFIIVINWKLGIATLLPALVLLVFTQIISPWIKRMNATNLKDVGGMSAEIAESLDHFKVVVAFNRRDYFRKKFSFANETNYKSALKAGIANNTLTPLYGLSSNIAQLIVLAYGLYLITSGSFTVGLLISFLSYSSRFYDPLRQMASVWSNFQIALAGWDRIHTILELKNNLLILPSTQPATDNKAASARMEFKNVGFSYAENTTVLQHVTFTLLAGKTYALVGPTGGGKTTTASLMARLYDPTEGVILLEGKDIRSYKPDERAQKIGFILQEPYLFTGTVRSNILYGNEQFKEFTNEKLEELIEKSGLETLLARFDDKLDTKVSVRGGALSLGQKQLIAFMRAVLRNPDLLILDEATANIDTVTEQLLESILKKLPPKTTKVIIAHRLNTIENADEIFFVNAGEVTPAGSMKQAIELLLHGKRRS